MNELKNQRFVALAACLALAAAASGIYLGRTAQSLAAANSGNDHTSIVRTVISTVNGNEKTTTNTTIETIEHAHDGLPMHNHVVTVTVAVTETTPHGTFHDFPPTAPEAPVIPEGGASNASGTGMPAHGNSTAGAGSGLKEAQIMILGREFSGGTLTVPVGTRVTWTSRDPETHTVTSDTGLFGQTLGQGGFFSYTFNETGVYKYHCENRPEMTGTITVQ